MVMAMAMVRSGQADRMVMEECPKLEMDGRRMVVTWGNRVTSGARSQVKLGHGHMCMSGLAWCRRSRGDGLTGRASKQRTGGEQAASIDQWFLYSVQQEAKAVTLLASSLVKYSLSQHMPAGRLRGGDMEGSASSAPVFSMLGNYGVQRTEIPV